MNRLIRELRRREVFRTTGLYVGVMWILIEASSVLLPAFDAPEWILQTLIIIAIIGLPVTVVLAWFFDLTERGIEIQAAATDTVVVPFGSRKADFVVIGILTVALIFSVYLNLTSKGPAVVEELVPISVLIADFDNQTGDPLFEGSLEQALNLGIEGAPFITSYRRSKALAEANEFDLGVTLDANAAHLVAVRQGINVVLAGTISAQGEKFLLDLKATDAAGEKIADVDASADSKANVLMAVNALAADMRKELGDDSLSVDQLAAGETVTVTSLEALKHYVTAQDLARAGSDEEAIAHYAKAIDSDPDFARAHSGWGLSAFKLGRRTEAEDKWQKALSLMDRMTERERYRTLGLYYTAVSLNYDKAIENFEQLVERYPADGAGHNNLSVLYFLDLQFDKAVAQSAELIDLYPNRTLYRSNHALNAMWAGDMETAVDAAMSVILEDPTAFKPYIVLAMAALEQGDVDSAREAYRNMQATGPRGKSRALIGLADLELFDGRPGAAEAMLLDGIAVDRAENNERDVGAKMVALAQAYSAQGKNAEALQTLRRLTDDNPREGQLIPAAEIYARLGDFEAAGAIAEELATKLRPQARAYARLINGIIALENGQYVQAVDELKAAIAYSDLWIVRYYLGQAYLAAGYPAEAISEFRAADFRRSEAMAMFFDDVPTWRYTACLRTWTDRAREKLADMAPDGPRRDERVAAIIATSACESSIYFRVTQIDEAAVPGGLIVR